MEAAKKNRKVLRGAFTRAANELEALLSAGEPDLDEVEISWDIVHRKFEEIIVANETVYSLLMEANSAEDVLEKDVCECDVYLKRYTTLRIKSQAFGKRDVSTNKESEAGSAGGASGKLNFKLPKIEIKRFSGEIKDWLGFWAQFSKVHEDETIDVRDKIAYLQQATIPGSRARRVVDSFPAVAENYQKMVDCLKARYGREDLQIEVYVRELLKLILNNSVARGGVDISLLYDCIETQMRALETLGITKKNCAAILFPLIESCLPESLLRAWQRSSEFNGAGTVQAEQSVEASPLKHRLEGIMRFLEREVENEQRIVLANDKFGLGKTSPSKPATTALKNRPSQVSEQKMATAACLVNSEIPKCVFCEGAHASSDCFKAQGLTLDERKELLRKKGRCFRCLTPGHMSRRCWGKQKCTLCGGSHVTLMCSKEEVKEQPVSQTLTNQTRSSVVYQTLYVNLVCGPNSRKVRVFLDGGSGRSYILASTAKEMGFKSLGSETVVHSLFGGLITRPQEHTCFEIKLADDSGHSFVLNVLDQPEICNPISPILQGDWSNELRSHDIRLSDVSNSGPIEVLLGADIVGHLYTGRKVDLQCGLTAMETILGWTLIGRNPAGKTSDDSAMTVLSLYVDNATITKLWDLDVLGITDSAERKTRAQLELAAKELVLQTLQRDEDGRYIVRLPWLEGHPPLPSNKKLAERRLDSTLKKLNSNELLEDYEHVFEEWQDECIIERISNEEINIEPCHYLAHRPVVKEGSTTKMRPVFDASAHEKGKPSLNDCLEVGPNLIESIPSLLLRFRIAKVGVVSDVKKAFLQIGVDEADRNFLRFLWTDSDGKRVIYRHRRVVFGVNSSPFLLGAVISEHLRACGEKCGTPGVSYSKQTIDRLSSCFYVDNCVTSFTSETSLGVFIKEAVSVMNEGKFELRGWEHTSFEEESEEERLVSVLGLVWNAKKDSLMINEKWFKSDVIENKIITKRLILSVAQRVFDPIGYTCPATLQPKILLQLTWSRKTSWDAPVDEDIERVFQEWVKGLPYLFRIRIPRWVRAGPGEARHWSVHVFCDASKDAYAAVVFLRAELENEVLVHLIAARARVAPLKGITIPRLELLAATLGARLGSSVMNDIGEEVQIHYWSDSSTVVSWIQRFEEWATFVGNRVKEIRSLTRTECWRHLPGPMNPADLPSRGCSPQHLYDSKWWEGPEWLYKDPAQWPHCELITAEEEEILKEKKKGVVVSMLDTTGDYWHLSYFSKFEKTLRMIAWIHRFVNNSRDRQRRTTGTLTVAEIEAAEIFVWKIVQKEHFEGEGDLRLRTLHPFRDKTELIRLKTKISHREDTEFFRFPVVLPGKHPLVQQMIYDFHEKSLHVGSQGILGLLREKYWIIGGRRIIRSVLSHCTICRKQNSKPFQEESPALPIDRVRDAAPFEITGVDFAGPLILKSGEKVWVCLFTCAIYRAVHLELAMSLSTPCFVNALRRFVARRGRPHTIYSDNGTNFVGTANMLTNLDWNRVSEYATTQRIVWRFNPPTAAWWGGFWERLIGILKRLLRKVLGNACLSFEDLSTLVCECEDVINSRPITYVSSDTRDLSVLTPALFLRELRSVGVPDCDAVDRDSLCRKARHRQKLCDDLRQRFRSEYLGQLKFQNGNCSSPVVKLGDIVLVGSDGKKRLDWPIGRITELVPGKDGKVRLVRVHTANGSLLRPIQRLFPLECQGSSEPPLEGSDLSEAPPEPAVAEPPREDVPVAAGSVNSARDVKVKKGNSSAVASPVSVTRSGRISRLPKRFM